MIGGLQLIEAQLMVTRKALAEEIAFNKKLREENAALKVKLASLEAFRSTPVITGTNPSIVLTGELAFS